MGFLRKLLGDERGQLFAGYIIAVFIIMSVVVTVTLNITRGQKYSQRVEYRDLAMHAAKSGIMDMETFFQRQIGGVNMVGNFGGSNFDGRQDYYAPTTVTPWCAWPDAAFLPGAKDTDNFDLLSYTAEASLPVSWTAGHTGRLTPAARGIMRTFPAHSERLTSTGASVDTGRIFVRYVVRRQNARNWSPGANTYSAKTDTDAVHDLTGLRGEGTFGGGTYWSVVSNGYVFSYTRNLSTNAMVTDLTISAAHENNDLLEAPLGRFLGKPLLLARARVYGEIYQVNVNVPGDGQDAAGGAIYLPSGSTLTVQAKARVNGQGAFCVAKPSSDSTNVARGSTSAQLAGDSGLTYTAGVRAPSFNVIFPGMTKKLLWERADFKGSSINIFPDRNSTEYTDRTNRTSFYYLTTTGGTGTITFPTDNARVMSGKGLVIVEGNLVIEPRNYSSWQGIVFVDGTVNLRGAEIGGMLIFSKGPSVLSDAADADTTFVEYNADMVKDTVNYMRRFALLRSSVVATQ